MMTRLNGLERRATFAAQTCAIALTVFAVGASAHDGDTNNRGDPDRQTVSPIKHVIVIVGENRSFDHLFATYRPRHKHEQVLNLLSEGIINADGSPGRNFAQGQTEEEIVAVSLKAGFENLSHFYHLFRKRFQLSPARYRKAHRRVIIPKS